MSTQKFTLSEAVNFGWNKTKDNLGFLIAVIIILMAVSGLQSLINQNVDLSASMLIGLVFWVINIFIGIGVIKITLKIYDGQKPEFDLLWSGGSIFLNYFIGSLLYSLIVIGGILLLIIPGIIWSVKYSFVTYLIVDKGMSPNEALHKSGEITNGSKWQLFWFGIVLGLINIVGALIFFVGLLFTIPLTMLAMTYVYRRLLGQTPAATPTPTSTPVQTPPASSI